AERRGEPDPRPARGRGDAREAGSRRDARQARGARQAGADRDGALVQRDQDRRHPGRLKQRGGMAMQQGGKIIIAGAGLGGLTAAAGLLERGFQVKVYEQAWVLGEVGAGIQSSANAVKVLYALGLREALDRFVVRPKAFEYRRFDTAELMHRIPLG